MRTLNMGKQSSRMASAVRSGSKPRVIGKTAAYIRGLGRELVYKNSNASRKLVNSGQAARLNTLLTGSGKGGVNPAYFRNVFNSNPIRYAIVNPNTKNVNAFAIARPGTTPNSMYVDVLAAAKGYGPFLMKEIKKDMRLRGLTNLKLKAVVQNGHERNPRENNLVRWYMNKAGMTPVLTGKKKPVFRAQGGLAPLQFSLRKSVRPNRYPSPTRRSV